MKKITTITLSVIAGSVLAYNAYSLTCAQQPTCESLGYTLTSTSDCIGTVLKCPFNTARYYCTTKTEALNKLTTDIVAAGIPDYSKKENKETNREYIASSNGFLIGYDSMRGDAGSKCDAWLQVKINGVNVRVGDTQINWSSNSWAYPIKKGSTYKFEYTDPGCQGLWAALHFVPSK